MRFFSITHSKNKSYKISEKNVLSGGFFARGFLSRGLLSGGLCPGGFCLEGFCPRTVFIKVLESGVSIILQKTLNDVLVKIFFDE